MAVIASGRGATCTATVTSASETTANAYTAFGARESEPAIITVIQLQSGGVALLEQPGGLPLTVMNF